MTEVGKWNLEVLSLRRAGVEFYWIELAAPPQWESKPGQFFNIRCDDPAETSRVERVLEYGEEGPRPSLLGRENREITPLVRRPVSISDVRTDLDGRRRIVLLLRVVGPGSEYISKRRVGDRLDVIGPIGNSFDLDTPGDRAYLVGGGCGIAPLVGLGRGLAGRGKKVTIFYGCRTGQLVALTIPAEARAMGDGVQVLEGVAELGAAKLIVATEDGSLGTGGLVTDAMVTHTAEVGWEGASVFACGPDVMMSAVAALAKINDVARCQVSLENYMGCAIGVCLSCAVKLRTDDERGWTHRFVCQDGPVFEAGEVIFENKFEGCRR